MRKTQGVKSKLQISSKQLNPLRMCVKFILNVKLSPSTPSSICRRAFKGTRSTRGYFQEHLVFFLDEITPQYSRHVTTFLDWFSPGDLLLHFSSPGMRISNALLPLLLLAHPISSYPSLLGKRTTIDNRKLGTFEKTLQLLQFCVGEEKDKFLI